jgi:hypothetical protein
MRRETGDPAMTPLRLALALGAVVGVSALGVASIHEYLIGRAEVAAADAAAQRSEWAVSIVHARAAALSLAPGNPWPERGVARLEAIGRDAEARGDAMTGLLAYGALRTAALAARAPGSRAVAWRAAAEEGLARVAGLAVAVPTAAPRAARVDEVASTKAGGGSAEAAASMLAALRRDDRRTTGVLAVFGFSTASVIVGSLLLSLQGRAKARLARWLLVCGAVAVAAVLLLN